MQLVQPLRFDPLSCTLLGCCFPLQQYAGTTVHTALALAEPNYSLMCILFGKVETAVVGVVAPAERKLSSLQSAAFLKPWDSKGLRVFHVLV